MERSPSRSDSLRLKRRSVLILGLGAAAALGDRLAVAGSRPPVRVATPAAASQGQTRRHFIAAEEVDWDYAPSGQDLIGGGPFDSQAQVFVEPGPGRIGRVYRKARYTGYTDDTFSTPLPADPAWAHLGILGPVIHATVGDTIEVTFLNRTTRPVGLHPHGVRYTKANEGAPYADGTSGDDRRDEAIPPGERYVYTWSVPERSGPAEHDPSSVLWAYHSHTDEVSDTYAGLVGPLIVTRAGTARADATPSDVDREFVLLFAVMNENASPYLDENIGRIEGGDADVGDDEFAESNLMHAVNGFVYGNLPGLRMRAGERVRWYVVGMGTEVDLHTPHWHGETLTMGGMRMDMVELLPMSMKALDMVPDEPGTWLLHCHVNDHLVAGMSALYTVDPA